MWVKKRDAIVVSIVYFTFGITWIMFSDWLVLRVAENTTGYAYLSLIKGIVFVILSTFVIYITLFFQQKSRKSLEEDIVNKSNVTEEYRDLLKNQKQLLYNLIDESPVPMILHSENRRILRLSNAFTTKTGYRQSELPTIKSFTESCWPHKSDEIYSHFTQLYDIKDKIFEGTFTLETKNETHLTWELHSAYIGRDDEGLKNVITIGIDVTEERAKEKDLTYLSYHDDLTGLYNRRYYTQMTSHFSKFKDIGLILADINGLKLVNDLFGHEYGDKLLETFAKILKSTLPRDAFIARLGGDEFVIVLYKYELNSVKALVKDIKKTVQENVIKDIIPTAAFGYSKKSVKEPLQNTFTRAENMLYRDKVHEYDKQTDAMLGSILNTLYKRTDESEARINNLKNLAKPLHRAFKLNEDQINELNTLIELHDIGKISLNESLFKGKRLSDEEAIEIRRHPEVGYRIANALPRLKNVAYAILTHHENVDGSGYPFGLEKDEIPFVARIFRVIDSYDAMLKDCPYSKAKTKKEALKELEDYAETLYDTSVVVAFKASVQEIQA